MALPEFLGIGVGRAGTTWLHDALRQHPGLFLAEKELHFFNEASATRPDLYATKGLGWYESLFARAPDGAVRGEISPGYFGSATARARIAETLPGARLVLCLRNPVERTLSMHRYALSKGRAREPLDAILADPSRRAAVLGQSLYADRLEAWRRAMPEAPLLVLLTEEIRADAAGAFRRVSAHLGVSEDFVPEAVDETVNAARRLRSAGLERALVWGARTLSRAGAGGLREAIRRTGVPQAVQRLNRGPEVETGVAPGTRAAMAAYYREDVERLSRLLDRDLSHWLAPAAG